MSFEKQISVFNNSKIIVSPHGAGLANTIFCRKNTKILEFFLKIIQIEFIKEFPR